jgi:MSHA biogenesis protein MshE
MRDRETAEIGLRAAMTGHLVLSTLHTNSAPATVMRLVDMGAQGFMVAAALDGVVAQRLVRRVCDSCGEDRSPSPDQVAWLSGATETEVTEDQTFKVGRGCAYCSNTGYRGRIGVYELLEMDEELTDALRRMDTSEFSALAREREGYRPLLDCALDYAREGITSLDEVIRLAGGLDELRDSEMDPARLMEDSAE